MNTAQHTTTSPSPDVFITHTVYSTETTTPMATTPSPISMTTPSPVTMDSTSPVSSYPVGSTYPRDETYTPSSGPMNTTPMATTPSPYPMTTNEPTTMVPGAPTTTMSDYQYANQEKTGRTKDSIFFHGPAPSAGSTQYLRTLERDHQEFRRLYNDFLSASSLSEKLEIKNELIRGLSIHDFITETVLFPSILKEVPNGAEMVGLFKTRDAKLRQSLITLDRMKIDDPTFNQTFATMFEELEYLMNEKETTLLPPLQRVIRVEKAEELGRAMDAARRKAPTRPHPNATTSSVLGAIAAPIDKLKDKMRDFATSSPQSSTQSSGIVYSDNVGK